MFPVVTVHDMAVLFGIGYALGVITCGWLAWKITRKK